MQRLTSIGNDLPAIFLVNFGISFIKPSAKSRSASGWPSSTISSIVTAVALQMSAQRLPA